MGLRRVLARAAVARAHVLVVEAPGAFRERVALERALARTGWCTAESAADADVLAVVGEPGPALAALVDRVWDQLSEPRARLEVRAGTDLVAVLDQARTALLDDPAQRVAAAGHDRFTPSADTGEPGDEHGDDDPMRPDGIALAEGDQDRDGLEMDALHLPLGPVLAHWPAGVVLRLTLHGDVVSGAEVETLPGLRVPVADDLATRAARLLDAVASVLTLAGAPTDAAEARLLRDRCLDVGPEDRPEDRPEGLLEPALVRRLGERLGRRRVLRRLLADLVVRGRQGGSRGLHEQLLDLVDRAEQALGGVEDERVRPGVNALPDLVAGLELAAVRLWMAALLPDLSVVGHEERTRG